MVLTKEDASKSDEQVEQISRDYNTQYRACVRLIIYILSKIVDFCFAVNKLIKFSPNPGKVHF